MSYESKMCNPETGKMFDRLATLVRESIVVPNYLLPVEMHDNTRGGRTLERLEQLCDERDGNTEHRKLKELKARNIEKLAAQVEAKTIRNGHGDFVDLDSELDYSANECDDLALTRKMMALVGGMVNGGVIDADDLLED
jgi:site-specific recombinase